MGWKLFGKGSSLKERLSVWEPQIEEVRRQLESMEQRLQAAPEQGEQHLSALAQIQESLKKLSDEESLSPIISPAIQQVDHAIQAMRNHDHSGALASIKEGIATIHRIVGEVRSQ